MPLWIRLQQVLSVVSWAAQFASHTEVAAVCWGFSDSLELNPSEGDGVLNAERSPGAGSDSS